jgi:hypothetical protein
VEFGEICRVDVFFNPVACCFLYKAKVLSASLVDSIKIFFLLFETNAVYSMQRKSCTKEPCRESVYTLCLTMYEIYFKCELEAYVHPRRSEPPTQNNLETKPLVILHIIILIAWRSELYCNAKQASRSSTVISATVIILIS